MGRKKLTSRITRAVLYRCAWTCCVCRSAPAQQFHHIDKDNQNNDEQNLIGLCLSCHGEAHTKHDLAQNLTSEHLRHAKTEWEREVSERASSSMLPSHNDPTIGQPIWGYVNHSRLWQFMQARGVAFRPEVFGSLFIDGYINEIGVPQRVREPSPFRSFWTVYDYLPHESGSLVHHLACLAINDLILATAPIDLDAIWQRKNVRALLQPGTFCFTLRAFYFKRRLQLPDMRAEERIVYAQAKGIRVEMLVSTMDMFGSSSIANSFCGRRCAAAFFVAKSIDMQDGHLVISGTPIALGTGFVPLRKDSPYFYPRSFFS